MLYICSISVEVACVSLLFLDSSILVCRESSAVLPHSWVEPISLVLETSGPLGIPKETLSECLPAIPVLIELVLEKDLPVDTSFLDEVSTSPDSVAFCTNSLIFGSIPIILG